MSHAATNWAIKQRGLEPASKLLLWQLADRHNKDSGRCDPSQDRLSEDCEMSRATVNRHLVKLEKAGMIKRVQRINRRTKKQENTYYLLAFDNDLTVSQNDTRAVSQIEQEPCLKSDESRVSNCDTNPVREPGREPVCAAEAAQHTHASFNEFWSAYPRPSDRAGTEKAFADALSAGADPASIIAAAKAYAAENVGNAKQYVAYPINWLKAGRWQDHAEPTKASSDSSADAEQAVRISYVRAISNGHASLARHCPVPMALELIAENRVTVDQCRAMGVAV